MEKRRNTTNVAIIKGLAAKYDVSKRFVEMSIKGERESDCAEQIKSEYEKLDSASKAYTKGLLEGINIKYREV